MKTLLVISNCTNGLISFRKEVMAAFAKEYKVIILSPEEDRRGILTSLGCELIRYPLERRGTNPLKELWLITLFDRHIRRIRPDLVLTYTIKPNIYAGMVCAFRKIPYIATITGLGTSLENGGLSARFSKILYRIGLKKAACVFFQNSANKSFFE